MLAILILLICTLLLGYIWGKHDGRVEGYEQGIVNLPLLLREQSYGQGYCILCNEQLEKKPSD
jgi:hypothetical protein